MIESQRRRIPNQGMRASYLAATRRAFELRIDLLMRLDAREPGRGHAGAALQASEQARARSLLDMLAETRGDIREGVPAGLVAREADARRRLNEAAARAAAPAPREDPAQLAEAVQAAVDDYERIQAELRAQSPKYRALGTAGPVDARGDSAAGRRCRLATDRIRARRRSKLRVGCEPDWLRVVRAAAAAGHRRRRPPRPRHDRRQPPDGPRGRRAHRHGGAERSDPAAAGGRPHGRASPDRARRRAAVRSVCRSSHTWPRDGAARRRPRDRTAPIGVDRARAASGRSRPRRARSPGGRAGRSGARRG